MTIDADEAVRPLVDRVEVLVEAETSNRGGFRNRGEPQSFPVLLKPFPIEFNVSANEGDMNAYFQVTATARDTNNGVVGQARALRKYTGGNRLTLRLLLEVECVRPKDLCVSGMTCHDGTCVEAHYDGGELVRNDAPLSDAAGVPTGSNDPMVTAGEGCSDKGERGCASWQVPVICQEGMWQAQSQCPNDEMCDGSIGECQPIAPECENRAPGLEFCDGEEKRVCRSKFQVERRTCLANEVCRMKDDKATCGCEDGFVAMGAGCREATDCKINRGGCDPLTECSMSGSTRECSPCPPGFAGTGEEGCEPLLTGIEPSAGTLTPAFDPNIVQYSIEVPLLVQRLTLTPMAASEAQIRLNGAELPESGSWTTPTLPLGEYTVELALAVSSGSTREYKIVVKRRGQQTTYIKANNAGAEDRLGVSLALDGDTLVATSMYEDSSTQQVNGDGTNDDASNSGAAYVFVRRGDTWEQQAYLKPMDAARDGYFGTSAAIDGDTIIIGAIRDNVFNLTNSGAAPGAVYVFTRTNGIWSQTDRLTGATGMNADLFGYMIAIEGDTIVVGAPRDSGTGAAYVFAREGASFRERQKLEPKTPVSDSMFGTAVGISGDTIVVGAQDDSTEMRGAGSATVFVRDASGWVEQQRLAPSMPADGGSFGYALGIHGDTILIGAPRIAAILTPGTYSSGEVYVYERTGTTWRELPQILKSMVPRASDGFGSSVSLRKDAALIGATGDKSGDIGVDADASRRDAEYAGAAYLYAREGEAWRPSVYLKASNAESNDMFGFGAALSDDIAVVSAVWEASSATEINGDETDNDARQCGALYVFQ